MLSRRTRSTFELSVILAAGVCALSAHLVAFAEDGEYLTGIEWREPPVVRPGETNSDPPSDAIVLFDGKSLDAWRNGDKWKIEDGAAIVQDTDITTKQSFGDCQLHVEWSAPTEIKGESQGRGNSGVFLMDRYEMQVLDSYDNDTYFDGQAGAIYKQTPPMVNAMRKPGEWNTYDIIWTAPVFNDDGTLKSPAYITALHNGVLVLNHFALKGNTPFNRPPSYEKHGKLPIHLQNHGNPVRYRNIWVREIKAPEGHQAREPFYRDGDREWPAETNAKTSAVSGRITIGGRPLRDGKIILQPVAAGQAIEANVNDGLFRLARVTAGQYKVSVQSTERGRESSVPSRYTRADASGLTVNVRDGDNEFEFDLRPR